MQPLDWETGKDEHVTEEGCSMIEGAIFDMDGLMFDTEPIWTRTWAPVLATIGIEYPEGLADAVRGTSGKSMEAIINRYAPEADATYVREKAYEMVHEELKKGAPKKPGLDELLAYLAEQGIPMLRGLVEQADGRIIIMPGAGVNPQNASRILSETGAYEIHGSLRSGGHTDAALVRALLDSCRQ